MLHYGWRWSFWFSALIGLIVGAIWYLAGRDAPEEHGSVSASELAYIQQGRSLPSQTAGSRGKKVPWKKILQSREVWAVTVSYFCYGYVAAIFFSWFYIYLAQVRGLDLKSSAFYSTLPPLAMVACSLLGGVVNDRLSSVYGKRVGRCGIAAFALALAAMLLVLGSRAASAPTASLVLAGGAGALYLAQSSYWSVTADIAGPSAGSASGFMNMGAQFGSAVTALLTPVIAAHFGWTYPFLVAATLSALGALAWLFVNPARLLAATETSGAS